MKAFKTTMLPHHLFGILGKLLMILGKLLMNRDASSAFVMQEFLNVDFFSFKMK
jgi:hypothetical protein